MRGAKVYAHRNHVIMQIGCNPHHRVVKLNFDRYKNRMLSQSDYLNYIVKNTQSDSTIKLDPTIAAEILAGFMGGKKIPDLIASLKPLDEKKEKVGQVVTAVSAVAFGFDAGEWAAQQLSNSCSREAVYGTALTKSFWKRLKIYVIATYLKEYEACQPPPFQTKSLSDYFTLKQVFGIDQYYSNPYLSAQDIPTQKFFVDVRWFYEGKYLHIFIKQFERNRNEGMDSKIGFYISDNDLHQLENDLSNYQKHVENEHPLIKAAYSEAHFIANPNYSPISLRHTQIIDLVNYINFNCSRVNRNLVWSPSSRRPRSRAPHRHN